MLYLRAFNKCLVLIQATGNFHGNSADYNEYSISFNLFRSWRDDEHGRVYAPAVHID